jgi:hypothetical protein
MIIKKTQTTIEQILSIADVNFIKYYIFKLPDGNYVVTFESPCPIKQLVITGKQFKSIQK